MRHLFKVPTTLGEVADNLNRISAAADIDARTRAGLALTTVVSFLVDQPGFSKDSVGPLWALLTAFGELDAGVRSNLFKPAHIPHRPPMSSENQLVMAFASTALDMLVAYRGASLNEASRKVDTLLKRAGFPSSSPEKIRGWRERLSEGPGRVPPDALVIWNSYQAQRKLGLGINVEGKLAYIEATVRRLILNNPPT